MGQIAGKQPISLGEVSEAFRGLIERRRRHCAFLFSTAAAFSILFDGVLHGRVPEGLGVSEPVLLQSGTVALAFLCLVTALREARIHRGMMFNGVVYQLLLQLKPELQSFLQPKDPLKLRFFGVSAILCFLAAGMAAGLMFFALIAFGISGGLAMVPSGIILFLVVAYYVGQHSVGARLGFAHWARFQTQEPGADEIRRHLVSSIDDAHRDSLELLGVSGLMAFCGFQVLSGLGDTPLRVVGALSMQDLQSWGALALPAFMTFGTTLILIGTVRLRLVIGSFSLLLDPADEPFELTSLDDAFFGFVILVALWAFDLFLVLSTRLSDSSSAGALVMACALILLVIERVVMLRASRMPHAAAR